METEGSTLWSLRLAEADDVTQLEQLIPISARRLQAEVYTEAQIQKAIGPVFGVDRQLIADRTYFVATASGVVIAGGGWSRRRSLFGGDSARRVADELLDPAREPARIRAFFVHPDWARRGIGTAMIRACESALVEAGFRRVEIVATLTGVPLYRSAGYEIVSEDEIPLGGSDALPVVRLRKTFLA